MSDEVTTEKHLSRGARRMGRALRRSWQAIVVVLLVAALGVLAYVSPGLVQADVRLDEGTVHVAKRDAGLVGIVNAQIDELADATAVGDSEFVILQDEEYVLVHGTQSSTLGEYNPGRNRMESPVQLPTDAQVQFAGGTLLVVNSNNGRVWFGSPEDVLSYDFQNQKAAFEVGEFGTATVTAAGRVIGLDVQRSVLVRRNGPDSTSEVSLPFTFNPDTASVAISAVGNRAVVLDRSTGLVWVEGMESTFEVSGAAGAYLAEPAPDALGGEDGARAIYATAAGLIALTSDGPRSLSGNLEANAIRPVQVGGCVYGAFGDQFVRKCAGQDPHIEQIPNIGDDPVLQFQVSRGTVALNDLTNGHIWMVDKGMLEIVDWGDVAPAEGAETSETVDPNPIIPPDRTQPNQDPIAVDDNLAARAGRSTTLMVLDNDSDPDGDVLTISAPTDLDGATLQTVRGGSGLQITIDAETTGTLTFRYTISDGRGGSSSANVTVRVLSPDAAQDNSAPHKHVYAQPVTIQLGQTVTKRVLMDWRDPDGDSLILVDAWLPPDAEDEVSFTPDGQVTFLDIGKTTGTKEVLVRVSDGYVESEGEMIVNVVDEVVAPIAYGDYTTVPVGGTVTVHPLENDIGANLALTEVDPGDCECTVSPNFRERWFTFSAEKAGTHYVTYKVSNGPVAMGLVRIDVQAQSSNTPPVAALDVALLPPGGSVLIDPLENDTDADGDVLVVQQVSQHPGLEVVLERRSLVTITARHMPDSPVTLSYRVSDGQHSVPGTIVVVPTTSTGTVQPSAERDEVRVRAGSTQSVDVLANDYSPIGLELKLDELVENPLGDRAWISNGRINVSVPAGAQAANMNVTYQISDSDGRIASSQLRITVISEDAQNEPPVPRQLVERVLAGTTTRLSVPLDGIDPNGDAVRLVGIGSGPQLGRVLATGDGWLTYEAFPGSQGTDVFSYQVVDSQGAVSEGEIRVGVAPPGPDNTPPTGVADIIHTRPGRHVQVAALRNDVDIDGDSIGFVASDPVEIAGIEGAEVVEGREITFVAPIEPGTYVGKYYIEDARGGMGSGDLTVIVDEEAPLLPPEARDDLVQVNAVIDEDWVEVDPLANDFDPDGPHEKLRVSVPDDVDADDENSPRATDDGLRIAAPVTDSMQQIRYVVTDEDGLSDIGLILLPGRNDSVPVLIDPSIRLEAVAGQPLGIELNSYVSGTEGRSVRLTGIDTVAATNGRVLPGSQRIEYTPELTYEGPASVVFEVSDVVAEGDKTAKRAYISIPIEVLPAPNRPTEEQGDEIEVGNSPPELIGSAPTLLVGPGEGEARLDLIPLFRDPDGDGIYFRDFAPAGGDSSISWNASGDGSKLYASTDVSTQPGTSRTIRAVAVDAKDATTPFEITLQVTSSTRPLATTVADVVDEAIAGQEVVVPVLLNDRSNLIDRPDLFLVQNSAAVVNGSGSIRTDGDSVRITPTAGFVGTLTARYTVEDATRDPNRRVDGTIRVTVKDKPSRPGAPRDGVAGNGTVTFTYTPGSNNGLEIASRVATAYNASGSVVASVECPSTTCTFTGLPNGQPYQFDVVETNLAGPSDRSPRSAPYTPDVRPSAPAAPTTTFGDKQLVVSWHPPTWEDPTNPGSPVDRYSLALLDEGGNQIDLRTDLPPTTTTYTWLGLANGTRYRFKVLAGNRAGESPYSEFSDVDWPAGLPAAPASVTATATENELGGAFRVSWPATGIEANGDPIRNFIITPVSQSGGVRTDKEQVVAVTGAASQATLIEGLGQTAYKFQVRTENKAGRGPVVATTDWQYAFKIPKIEYFAAERRDGAIQMWTRTNFEGIPEAEPQVMYRLNGGAWRPYPSGGLATGLENGETYNIEVKLMIVGDRESNTMTRDGVMPRSTEPQFPTVNMSSLRNAGWNEGSRDRGGIYVAMNSPADPRNTGGWPSDGYYFSCDLRGVWNIACNPNGRTASHDFVARQDELATGGVIEIETWHRSTRGPTYEVPVEAPLTYSWDNESKLLEFNLRYVKDGLSCTAYFNDDITETWTTPSFSMTFPKPEIDEEGNVEEGNFVNQNYVDITCRNPHFSGQADSIRIHSN